MKKRLSSLSSNKACFNKAAPLYQKLYVIADINTSYATSQINQARERTESKATFFGKTLPPYSKSINNIGRNFLALIKNVSQKDQLQLQEQYQTDCQQSY